ncbi:hypothetical protein [Vibrio cortegadensis]|uniref:hypothetical protein n=1 Tax=Vibrio cortegadensis TaxID=1328770 RepID=UPI00352E9E98
MGLMIHSLGEVPAHAERDYYLYLLDYGWKEPIRDSLMSNFHNMADRASRTNSVVFKGTVGHHFSDEVLSWHDVNGIDGESCLPAILITTRNPHEFRERPRRRSEAIDHNLLLIPIKELCTTATEVVTLVEKIFNDIENKKALTEFEVAKEIKAGQSRSIVDTLVLQPNFCGVGVDLKKIAEFFRLR